MIYVFFISYRNCSLIRDIEPIYVYIFFPGYFLFDFHYSFLVGVYINQWLLLCYYYTSYYATILVLYHFYTLFIVLYLILLLTEMKANERATMVEDIAVSVDRSVRRGVVETVTNPLANLVVKTARQLADPLQV